MDPGHHPVGPSGQAPWPGTTYPPTQHQGGYAPPPPPDQPYWSYGAVNPPPGWASPATVAKPRRWIVTLVVVAVALLLIVVGLTLDRLGLNPTLTTPTPDVTTPAVPPPAASGTPKGKDEETLMRNPLYALTISGACPKQDSPGSRAEYEAQVAALLGCLAKVYEPLVSAAGFDFRPVSHTFFGDSTSSPCGGDQDAYAFYCEENSTIYFSGDVYQDADEARLLVADVTIHEYGHHVQSMIGLFDADEEWDGEATGRREELQTFCWTYYTLENVRGFDVDAEDERYFYWVMGQADDPEGHGSVKAQQLWGMRGLAATNFGSCNTWAAAVKEVD